jgi:ferredoxin
VVCPVECFWGDQKTLYIDPNDCIDCEACVPECPVEAIYAEANVPAQWQDNIQLNATRAAELKAGGKNNNIVQKQNPLEGPDCKAKK